MKVLVLGSYAESLLNFRGDLIRDIIKDGGRVVACAPNLSDYILSELKKIGAVSEEVRLSRDGLSPISDVKYMLSVCRLIKKHKPNLVLTYTVKPNIWGAFSARICGVKSISMITGLGYAFMQSGGVKQRIVGKIIRKMYGLSTSFNSLVIFQNTDDSGDFVKSGALVDASKARFVCGSGVDTAYFSETELPDQPVFLLIARLLKSKGVMEYAEASALVRKDFPDAKFLLVGFLETGPDGITKVDLDKCVEMGLEYLGKLQDVRAVMSASSVYVLPSYREGTPRSVLEAMSMGRPIITTDAPGCRETTTDGVNGFLVPVRNVSVLAEKMRILAESGELRSRFGSASRRVVEDKFTVKMVNETLLRHIAEVV